jgi:hypothetical protein
MNLTQRNKEIKMELTCSRNYEIFIILLIKQWEREWQTGVVEEKIDKVFS